ncbi:MAG: phosphatidylserine/phosphatidylglycerophosphate/cardiolipin synthase family protein [Elusimicrobia bacterium]|nr:phosphatidylserine/phosphatidylglycerophosphate/cardiolipin synthase family protein [Elusimicrobiota bacterium]
MTIDRKTTSRLLVPLSLILTCAAAQAQSRLKFGSMPALSGAASVGSLFDGGASGAALAVAPAAEVASVPTRSEADLRRELAAAVKSGDWAIMSLSPEARALATPAEKLQMLKTLMDAASRSSNNNGEGGDPDRWRRDAAMQGMLGSAPDAASFDWVYYRANTATMFRVMDSRGLRALSARYRAGAVPGDWDGYLSYLDTVAETKSAGRNQVQFLIDGADVIAPGLAVIDDAKYSIHMEVFQLQGDEVGKAVAERLAAKAAKGVKVRLLLDEHGTQPDEPSGGPVRELIALMRAGGVDVRVRKTPFGAGHLDHRKVMVVDGDVGFTGGMNIGKSYQMDWHDQQTMIIGPAVARLQDNFLEQWRAQGGAVDPNEPGVYPTIEEPANGVETRVVVHRGGAADQNIKAAYIRAFATAQTSIRIANPYFMDADVVQTLCEAAGRKVKVQVVLPEDNDVKIVQRGSRAYYPDLIQAGVEVYEYQGRMAHEKVAVIDTYWSTVGSSNLDTRSLSNNDELNLVLMDRKLAAYIERWLFDADLQRSKRIMQYTPTPRERLDRSLEELL